MKVLYELDLNDIIRIVADKYEVPQEKVKKTNKDGLNYLMIDMSTTETPSETVPEKKEEAEDDEEKRYEQITDERLQEYIAAGRTIPQICKAYRLTDSKYSARLYKRAEKFRSEEARLGRRKSNNTETEKA
jgi:hypothetical protein